jgi:prolyl-tRNA synthetase
VKTIEVGNIFPLGNKYSEQMKAFFTDEKGSKKNIIMGCYGIGTSRVMGAVIEVCHDEKGMIWPKEISPFSVHLISLSSEAKKASEEIYRDLQESGIDVLYDDRENKSAGEKLVDSDLIGIPLRLVVSEKTLAEDSAELKQRGKKETELVKIKGLAKNISSLIKKNV